MLEWNVIYENWNQRKMVTGNIFNHCGFYDDCKKAASEYGDDMPEFAKFVHASLRYYFWCKCEWEVIISCWPPSDNFKEKKLDVYEQINMNWDRFIEYLWTHKDELQ